MPEQWWEGWTAVTDVPTRLCIARFALHIKHSPSETGSGATQMNVPGEGQSFHSPPQPTEHWRDLTAI